MEKRETNKRKKYEKLRNLALKYGASRAAIFPARGVVVDARVRLKCQIPLCENFFRNLMCHCAPPVDLIRKIVKDYGAALLVQTVHPLGAMPDKPRHGSVIDAYASSIPLHTIINKLDGEAQKLGFSHATGYIGGPCRLCRECVGPLRKEECRHPFMARPSMESVGMDVEAIARNAGLPFDIPAVSEVVWNGLILLE